MSAVLVAVSGRVPSASLLAAARAISSVFGATMRAIHVQDEATHAIPDVAPERSDVMPTTIVTGDPIDEIVRAADDPEVVLVVVGAREHPTGPRPAGHVALGVAERVGKPVLVVPPAVPADSAPIRRALVPLEGTSETTNSVAECTTRLADAGVEVVVVHVFDESVPRFWDEASHASDAYTEEFLARWCREPRAQVRLRRGPAPASMMEMARTEDVDLIALGWSQTMDEGRARMVRLALAGPVPVLLVPTRF